MNENKYALAGWLAIGQMITFITGFILAAVEGAFHRDMLERFEPSIGLSDAFFLVQTIFAIYVALRFRSLLREYYQFHGVDTLIMAWIWWEVGFTAIGWLIEVISLQVWGVTPELAGLMWITYFGVSMVTIGVIDIIMAVILLRSKDLFDGTIQVFAWLLIFGGVLELTVVLSFLVLFLFLPAQLIVLAIIFFKDKEHRVEFV